MTTTKRTYGWKPDLPDHRDHIYSAVIPHAKLPPAADLRATMPPVYDQGELGSCTANAIAGAMQYAQVGNDGVTPSRLFIYRGERVIEGTVNQDSGAQIRDGIKFIVKSGACDENEWPYDIAKFKRKPPAKCFKDALKRRVTAYKRVTSLIDLKASIASGHPVVFGFTVYESFESEAVATTGMLEMPTSTERILGGHAVLAVGYDDASQRIIVRNSWGAQWGQSGYFTMPYAYVQSRNLSDDFWQVVK